MPKLRTVVGNKGSGLRDCRFKTRDQEENVYLGLVEKQSCKINHVLEKSTRPHTCSDFLHQNRRLGWPGAKLFSWVVTVRNGVPS